VRRKLILYSSPVYQPRATPPWGRLRAAGPDIIFHTFRACPGGGIPVIRVHTLYHTDRYSREFTRITVPYTGRAALPRSSGVSVDRVYCGIMVTPGRGVWWYTGSYPATPPRGTPTLPPPAGGSSTDTQSRGGEGAPSRGRGGGTRQGTGPIVYPTNINIHPGIA